MTPDRFATLIDAYGASPERWPASERQAALAYLRATPAAQALVAEAGRLDALLDRLEAPVVAIDLARITATAQEPAANVLAFKPKQRSLPQQFRQWARAGALAAAGICGLVVGMENFSDQAVRSANASTALELYDAGQVEDVSW
jgi:hypothetical protein